jgi:hypothetical protein
MLLRNSIAAAIAAGSDGDHCFAPCTGNFGGSDGPDSAYPSASRRPNTRNSALLHHSPQLIYAERARANRSVKHSTPLRRFVNGNDGLETALPAS